MLANSVEIRYKRKSLTNPEKVRYATDLVRTIDEGKARECLYFELASVPYPQPFPFFDEVELKKFKALRDAGIEREYLRSINESQYKKLLQFKQHLESHEPLDQDTFQAVVRRCNDFVAWFISRGFEVPKLAESIVANRSDNAQNSKPEDLKKTKALDFTFNPEYTSIVYHGKSYALTALQAKVVEILHEHHQKGTPEVRHAYILEKIDYSGKRLRDIFKRSGLWDTLIISSQKGVYRLDI